MEFNKQTVKALLGAPCTVSQHLSVLLGANLVKSADIGRRVYYSLNKERTDCFLDALCGLMKKDE